MQKGLGNLSTMFCISSVHWQPKKYCAFHWTTCPQSVLELELWMAGNALDVLLQFNFGFILICVHFLQRCSNIESIKSCSLPFLPNLYCTSIKRTTSILSGHFSKPWGWLRNRGGTLDVSFSAETDVLLVLKRNQKWTQLKIFPLPGAFPSE